MQNVFFAQIVTARIRRDGDVVQVVLGVEVGKAKDTKVFESAVLPSECLDPLMAQLGARDFEDLRNAVVRVRLDVDDEILDLAGPGDGQWLLDTLNPEQGADAALTA
jgi:hypothetical protein